MNKRFASFFVFVLLFASGIPVSSQATVNPFGQLEDTGNAVYGGKSGDFYQILGNVADAIFSLAGATLFLIMVYAGITWMTAGGNEDKVKDAKGWMINSIIGFFILAASFAISRAVLQMAIGTLTAAT